MVYYKMSDGEQPDCSPPEEEGGVSTPPEAPPKRGRGRPRKEPPTVKPEPKKRGRPKKEPAPEPTPPAPPPPSPQSPPPKPKRAPRATAAPKLPAQATPAAPRRAAPKKAPEADGPSLEDIAARVAGHMLSARGNWHNRKQDEWRGLYTFP